MRISEIYSDVLNENTRYEYKAVLNPEHPVKWAKTIVAYANGEGGILFVGVSNAGEVFGLDLDEVDKTKNLIALVNDRHIFPHARIRYTMRSVDADAEKFVLGVCVASADSVVRYREGDFNETVYVKGDGNSTPARPEDIIALSKRKFGVDNETTDVKYTPDRWQEYIRLCEEFREDAAAPALKELQNEEIVTKDEYVKSGFLMFADDYHEDDSLLCCRLWKGKNKAGVVLDSGRYKGSLASVFRSAVAFIERNTKTGWRKSKNGGRREVRSYPKEAIREALVNAIAHRDYSISGTQIDVDIYDDRIDIVSPGSWLLPKGYEEYPVGSIPSIRRNGIIAACLDAANLMERGGTGFQTMIESYKDSPEHLQPVVMIYPGFLDLRLYDRLYEEPARNDASGSGNRNRDGDGMSDCDRVLAILEENGPMPVKVLQETMQYGNRNTFLKNVINPLMETGAVYRDGEKKSHYSVIRLKE